MFNPLNVCKITKTASRKDVYGQEIPSTTVYTELCAVTRGTVSSQHTTVRADSSASRGYGDEIHHTVRFLMTPRTQVALNDKLECEGLSIRVQKLHRRFDVWGVLNHIEAEGETWD